jgi:eukaryotic-like serine/threonine-protein kinase
VPIARGRFNELQAEVSPNARWVAYASDESGRYEIYVQSFPDPNLAAKTTISAGGGVQPRWSTDGRELYYLRPDGVLIAVAAGTSGQAFSVGRATTLFQTNLPSLMNAYRSDYAVAPGGKGFAMKVAAEVGPPSMTVVLHWPALLKE